jgi:hypothetical protein
MSALNRLFFVRQRRGEEIQPRIKESAAGVQEKCGSENVLLPFDRQWPERGGGTREGGSPLSRGLVAGCLTERETFVANPRMKANLDRRRAAELLSRFLLRRFTRHGCSLLSSRLVRHYCLPGKIKRARAERLNVN